MLMQMDSNPASQMNVDPHGSGSATLPGAGVAASAALPPYPNRPAQEISLQTLVPNFQNSIRGTKEGQIYESKNARRWSHVLYISFVKTRPNK
jgi:hypothetical protein